MTSPPKSEPPWLWDNLPKVTFLFPKVLTRVFGSFKKKLSLSGLFFFPFLFSFSTNCFYRLRSPLRNCLYWVLVKEEKKKKKENRAAGKIQVCWRLNIRIGHTPGFRVKLRRVLVSSVRGGDGDRGSFLGRLDHSPSFVKPGPLSQRVPEYSTHPWASIPCEPILYSTLVCLFCKHTLQLFILNCVVC